MKSGLTIGTIGKLDRFADGSSVIHLGASQPVGAMVFSTPAMIDLMEHAAREALLPFLEDGEESVGATVSVEHLAATPINSVVRAEAKVTAIDGRLIDFELAAFDTQDQIGRGTHRRAVIRTEKFAARLEDKASQMREGSVLPVSPQPNHSDLPPLKTLRVERAGAIATVWLNRPAKLNAVDRQMTADLEELNAWLAGHPDVRVVIVTGSGEAFCAGDDVTEVGTLDLAEATRLSHRQASLYLAWEKLPQVFIAAINGVAFGGGCVLAYSCDFRIAAHSSRFSMPEIKLGWPPGYGIAQLTALVGKARALELCLTGKQITSQQASQYGLVHELVPQTRLLSSAGELAQQFLAQPAAALRLTKQLIHADEGTQAKQAYLADTAAYIQCLGLPDAQEGIAAFNEKRKPRFNGK
ncbi:thioesterase, FlK family [Schlesneria sp. DSM 10557]|uniref:thioesterase, FlK family n=1 Tax=Schlesneria sp. DSM 10557 TaxID=3044399 RepID=UPI00359FEFD5